MAATTRILALDDDSLIAELLDATLNGFGYDTVVATSPDQARAAVNGGFTPDVFLCDVQLGSLTGAEIANELGLLAPEMTTVFLSGHSEEHVRRLTGTSSPVLQKPFRLAELEGVLSEVLCA